MMTIPTVIYLLNGFKVIIVKYPNQEIYCTVALEICIVEVCTH